MNETKKIIVLGSSGFLGSNLCSYFSQNEKYEIIRCDKKEVNVLKENEVDEYIKCVKPDIIIHSCGIVGSSEMNKDMDENDIFHNNLIINNNILSCCKKYNISKLITFSTYRLFTDMIQDNYNETHIHSFYNIENNIGYLFSKKVLDLQIRLFNKSNFNTKVICFILPNVYGEYDKFETNGRIVSAFIKKIHLAKKNKTDLILNTNSENKVNLLYAKDVYNILKMSLEENIEGNILLFNKAGIITLKQLSEYLKTQLEFSQNILFTKEEPVHSSIMNPDTSTFETLFKNYSFYNVEDSLKETVQYFVMTSTGIL